MAKTKKHDDTEYFSDGMPIPEEPVDEASAPEDDPDAEYERLLDMSQLDEEEEDEDYAYGLVNIRVQMLQLAIAAFGKRNGSTTAQPAFLVTAAKTFEAYVLEDLDTKE